MVVFCFFCFFVRVERWGGGSCTVSQWRGPQTTTAAPILTAREKEKRAPSVPPASGPPSLPQRVYQSSPPALWQTPQSSPPLSSSSCLLLFVQPGRITWDGGRTRGPKPPRTNCFHLRPTFLDDALTNRVGRQLCPKMKLNYTKQVQRKGTDWSFDLLLGTLRPLFCLNAWAAPTYSGVCGHARMSCVLW